MALLHDNDDKSRRRQPDSEKTLENRESKVVDMECIDEVVSSLTLNKGRISIQAETQSKITNDPVIPHLDKSLLAGKASPTDSIRLLRRFHLGDPAAAVLAESPADSVLPALLDPYRGVVKYRHEYPLYLQPAVDEDHNCLAQPLIEFLPDSIEKFAPQAESSRILKDNLPWIERYICDQLIGSEGPVNAKALLNETGKALQKQMGLAKDYRELLQKDLDRLEDTLVEGSQFLSYGPNVAIHLLRHTVVNHTSWNRQKFQATVKEQVRGLSQLLAIEKGKSRAAQEPQRVQDRTGAGSRYFDSSALSEVLEHRPHGSTSMPAKRLERITEILDQLQSLGDQESPVYFVAAPASPWLEYRDKIDITEDPDPCARAAEIYDSEATRLASIFSASRIAQLEIEGKYDSAVHDSWFDSFNWEAFSQQELLLVPTVVALESVDRIASEGLQSFSHLLNSRKPVQILAWVHAHTNPGSESTAGPLTSFRLELAYFGIGHRQAVVTQASASRYKQLLDGFTTALDSTRTSLHLVNTGFRIHSEPSALDPWVMASAALESRAHPFIQVNPGSIDNDQAQINFEGNPYADLNWPTNVFSYRVEGDQGDELIETELSFTFADYCLLHPEFLKHFKVVPGDCDDDDLLSVDAYLAAPSDRLNKLIPFVWAVDSDGVLQKLVVSRNLLLACRDRQSYWHSLQALAGVRNTYVELAIKNIHEEEQTIAAADREQLQAEHAQELERVRTETAEQVMGQLTDVLLGLDLSSLSSGGTLVEQPLTPTPTTDIPPVEAENIETPAQLEEDKPVAEEDEISFDEPWIDSIFCTTCDDCMAINKQLFVYNDNKQAIITDPKSGTFAQLVKAAELCPAKCIHPGKPLNPDEPDLDELIGRAEPFNQ